MMNRFRFTKEGLDLVKYLGFDEKFIVPYVRGAVKIIIKIKDLSMILGTFGDEDVKNDVSCITMKALVKADRYIWTTGNTEFPRDIPLVIYHGRYAEIENKAIEESRLKKLYEGNSLFQKI